ncbi:MAG: DNA alkylation repair protein [Limimaricola sp.]|uniref:DNA alkylation repair protein n=1 Tax=Limimaricola sp. TaxID=2211665 RepID=UPI001D359313|nr:DNA alkylation repair protein [Limimaricola sp.]MBI1418518.1 DNA alkylation repair protein [Limimaricola sp.]
MTPAAALDQLRAAADPERAAGMAAYHKAPRPYLGLRVPVLTALVRDWRRDMDLSAQVALADGLWRSNIHEARIAAAKLLDRKRIVPDDAVWRLIASWVPDFDAWAIADHACIAGMKRLLADPSRLDEVEHWTRAPHMWSRRAALVITLPWTKDSAPDAMAVRERVLGWAAGYAADPDWFIQKAIGWWLRSLSDADPARVHAFLAAHGATMKPFARREALRHLQPKARERA